MQIAFNGPCSQASLLEIVLVIFTFTLDISQDALWYQLVKAAENKNIWTI